MTYGTEDYGDSASAAPISGPGLVPAAGHNNPPPVADIIRENHAELLAKVAALPAKVDALPKQLADDGDLKKASDVMAEIRTVKAAVKKAHETAKAPYKEGADACDVIFLTRGAGGTIDKLEKAIKALGDDYQSRKEAERREQLRKEQEAAEAEARARAQEAAALADAGAHRVADVVAEQAVQAEAAAEKLAVAAEKPVADLVRTNTGSMTVSGTKKWKGTIVDKSKIDLNLLRDCFLDHELEAAVDRFVNRGGRQLEGVAIEEKVVSSWR